MTPFEAYIRDISETRSSGQAVPETSYYTPLSNLLNEVGKTLKPGPMHNQHQESGSRHS